VLASPPASLCTHILPRTSARQHRIIRAEPNDTARQTAVQTAAHSFLTPIPVVHDLKLIRIVLEQGGGAETNEPLGYYRHLAGPILDER
jgi:hypothetical protein